MTIDLEARPSSTTTLPKGVSNDRYRVALQNARDEFLESPELNDMDFPEWLEMKYGVKMLKNSEGYYIMAYDVTDEKSYLMFQIKYFSQS